MPGETHAGEPVESNAEQVPGLSPYLELVGLRDGLMVWIVDGMSVRNTVDIEFTNFGQHFRFPFIPDKELWIDKEAAPDELEFFIAHLISERQLMAGGASYEEALDFASGNERELRQRAGDAVRLAGKGGPPDSRGVHARLWKELDSGVSVWIVDGRLVRSVFDIDFTEGGHDKVYEYVPSREVWIDNDLDGRESPFVLFHELHERNLMEQGWDVVSSIAP